MKYYLHLIGAGIVAAGSTPDGTFPSGAIECSEAQYKDSANWTISGGTIVAYTRPAIPLRESAEAALREVNQQAAFATAMGQTFGSAMRAYVGALQAIICGTDTASTALPIAPTNYTD